MIIQSKMLDTFTRQFIKTAGAEILVRSAGVGEPLVLLHGYPQTGVMWSRVASQLANDFFVVCPDLRGYGDSSKPDAGLNHEMYSKRAMAQDIIDVMQNLGFNEFFVAGHDRGGRVAHRLALDHPKSIKRICVMDIVPTLHMFDHTDQNFATGYYHWFFLIQGEDLPERMIGANPEYYLRMKLGQWSGPEAIFDPQAISEYVRCFSDPRTIHSTCEDYRAAAGIDLDHDRVDQGDKIKCPLLALWGDQGFIHKNFEVLSVWKEYAATVSGEALNCGHFLPEERPDEVIEGLTRFFV